jgi:glycosyltransferase involved in cell wall biosynthesis
MVMLFLTSSIAALLLAGFFYDFMSLRSTPHLHSSSRAHAPTGESQPLVSLLIPVRNEARNIARCLDGVLAQTYPAYEVIVVDDGSTDATPAILQDYAARHTHLRVLKGEPLPPDWTGKSHACQQAANAAQGSWLLFLDADTVAQPHLVSTLLAEAQEKQLEMLTIFPFLELGSFWERVILPPFVAIIQASFPFERLNAPDATPDEVIANGQCILVQRNAYDSIGGHGAVQGEVLEDVRLAQTLRAAGFRIGAVAGMAYLRVRMYTNRREVVEGLTKNAVAGYLSAGNRAAWAGLRQYLLGFAPFWLLMGGVVFLFLHGGVVAWVAFLQALVVMLVALGFWGWHLHQRYTLPVFYALFWQLGLLSYGAIAVHSLWRVRSGRGVVWKGRNYVGIS